MQQPPRESRLRHVTIIYLDPECYADMNAEAAKHRDLLFCNLGKGRNEKQLILQIVKTAISLYCRLSSTFHFCPSHPLSCRTSYSISDGSLCSRNNANRWYNVAIEAQKQKECDPMSFYDWNKLRQRMVLTLSWNQHSSVMLKHFQYTHGRI